MTSMSDQEIFDRWCAQPAPLLPILHAFHDRDGYLSDDALRAIAKALRQPIADLFGTVTFYHHFSRTPNGHQNPRVCTGPICCRRDGNALLENLRDQGATPMPCAGRCDEPTPILRGNQSFTSLGSATESDQPAPLPPENPGNHEECTFRHIREPNRHILAGYVVTGGYEALGKALKDTPEAVLTQLDESGLAGRGGAGFPTGRKWRAVADAPGSPKVVICNADEGEPGCFKDRALMQYDPHGLIEGMVLAAHATGATLGFIYLRYEYPEIQGILERAIGEAEHAGYLGKGIGGKAGFDFHIHVRRGAGAYICGEEGSLINSLEGKHPFPRNRPPFPVTHGFNDQPTAVNNVETLASVAPIIRKGADWYRNLGLGEHKGIKIISLSGDVRKPGNYEVPLGLPLQTLINDYAGGLQEGRTLQAVTMAGLSGGFLAGDDLNITLDEPAIRACGSFLGAGGIMVFDDSRDMVKVAEEAMRFFAHESCGKCFPCRIGTQRLTERLAKEAGPNTIADWRAEVEDIGTVMAKMSACGLGVAAPLITTSLMKYFPEQVDQHITATGV